MGAPTIWFRSYDTKRCCWCCSVDCWRSPIFIVYIYMQNGTYLRNGPGLWDVGDHAFDHLFDGYATLVRVSFRHGRATGAHRQIESDAYTSARANGRPVLREFSQCPPNSSLLDRVRNVVGTLTGAALTDNPNSAVLPLPVVVGDDGRRQVLCLTLTETTKSSILIDPDTLDTVGKFRYADKLGSMMIQSAHPITTTGGDELLTVIPDLARLPCRQDGVWEQREEGDRQSGLPWRPHAGMDALVRRHGQVRGGAGDAAPVLRHQPHQVGARPLLRLRLAPGVRQLHARHVQVHREHGRHRTSRCRRSWPSTTSMRTTTSTVPRSSSTAASTTATPPSSTRFSSAALVPSGVI